MLAGGRMDWTASEASFWVDLAYKEVATRIDFKVGGEALGYSSTTSGENRIALPSDFVAVLSLSNLSTQGAVGGRHLRQETAMWMDSQTTQLGEPEAYAVYSTWLELWPSPDSRYSLVLRYQNKNPTMVNSSDTPTLDERWHAAVLYRTVALLEASRGNAEGEAVAQNRYLNYMASTPTDLALQQKARTGMRLRFQKKED